MAVTAHSLGKFRRPQKKGGYANDFQKNYSINDPDLDGFFWLL
jgi:hypothetical protein